MNNNIILDTDSYKYSHYQQYPSNTEYVYSYVESRGGKYDQTVFFGLQMFLKEYLSKPITQEMIDEAQEIVDAHIGSGLFNREGWEYILKKHNGYLPIKIKSIPEGTVVSVRNVLATIENTDPKCYWLTSFIETAMLRSIWYPTTVATNSWSIKQVIKKYLEETGDVSALPFCLHDFGARGVSSSESAGLGGVSHLVNFQGTDTVESLIYAKKYYNEPMAGFSVPAAEHSSITTWGRDGELEAYRNMLTQFGGTFPVIAVVSDSYDIFNAVENMWGRELKAEVLDSGSKVVVRPDSSIGHPSEVVLQVVKLLDETFGTTTNEKGYKQLPPFIGVIQGDGVNQDSITKILQDLKDAGYSANNVVFGMGGALLQQLNRDTCKFAYKASWALINGKEVDVYKDPITDPGKRSKRGKLDLYKNQDGKLFTNREGLPGGLLQTVFENGKIIKEYSFDEVRQRSEDN